MCPFFLSAFSHYAYYRICGIVYQALCIDDPSFANIMGGHAIVLGLASIVFITAGMGAAISSSMTAVSVFFSVFILFLELLVAFIQAFIFTLLSSVFIGMARNS